MGSTPPIFIIVGTYEELLLGYKFTPDSLKIIFSDHSHLGSIRSVAISSNGRYFISGGSDETLQVYSNLFSRPCQIGGVHEHESTITRLRFIGEDGLLAIDDSGAMCIWNTSKWETPIHRFPKTHRKCAPIDLAIHPTGRLALTIASGDRTMRTWDLVRLRQAACVPCSDDDEPVSIFWSSDGEAYGILYKRKLETFITSDCTQLASIPFESTTASCVIFLNESKCVAVGFVSGEIIAYKLLKKKSTIRKMTILESKAGNGRVKSLEFVWAGNVNFLISADSMGWIRIFKIDWSIGEKEFGHFMEVSSVNTGARITCMAAIAEGDKGNGSGSIGEGKAGGGKKKKNNDGEMRKRKKRKIQPDSDGKK